MKQKLHNCIYIFCAFFFSCMSDAAGVSEKELLEEVIAMKDNKKAQGNPTVEKAFKECLQASSSNSKAVDFYVKSIKETGFSGGAGQNLAQFRAWEKKNAEKLKDNAFQNSIRIHLFYFCISLKKASGIENSELIGDLITHIDSVIASDDDTKTRYLAKVHISNSLFAKRYGVTEFLKQLKQKEWEDLPVKIKVIEAKIVMPELIKNKDMRVIQYLDKRLKQETDAIKASKDALRINNFNQLTKPEKLWKRAETLLLIGQRSQALQEMRQIVKTWPNHPNIETWLNALQSAITNPDVGTTFN